VRTAGRAEVRERPGHIKQGALIVKKTWFWATLVAALLATQIGSSAFAQQQQFVGGSVAIIDLSYIFKNHNRFKSMTEDMRHAVEAADTNLKAQKSRIEALEKQKNETELRKDSPEYKQMDAEVTRMKIDLNAQIALQKKEFIEREAKIYYNVYQEVLDAVQYFSQQNRISLVLRFNGDPVTEADPQEILKQLNKSVVYYDKAIDITPYILQDVNRSGVGTGPSRVPLPPRNGAVPQATRPGATQPARNF
jgi:Skp family chaperone for outer membrane proteins